MSANLVSNSANLSSLSRMCQRFSKFVFCKKMLQRHVSKLLLSASQQISIFLLTKQSLILLSKSCQQFSKSCSCKQIVLAISSLFFCRHQQHDYSAGISSFMLARQSTEMISLPVGSFFFIYDSHRIAAPCRAVRWCPVHDGRDSFACPFPT